MKKFAILGGTFNPVHNGHLYIALEVYNRFLLNGIFFVPAGNPHHKANEAILTYEFRSSLIKEAIKPFPFFIYSDLDKPSSSPSYTQVLMQKFHLEYPDTQFFFIIGEDNVPQLQFWHNSEQLINEVDFIVLSRNSAGKASYSDLSYAHKLHFINNPVMPVSSSLIRENLRTGKSIDGLVPEAIKNEIINNSSIISDI